MKKFVYILLLFTVFVDFSVFAGKGIKRKLEEDDASASISSASQSKRARKTKDLKDPSRYFNKETIEFFNAAIEAKDKNDHECAIHHFKNFLKNSRCVSRRNLSWIKEALEYLFQNPDESSFLSHYDFLVSIDNDYAQEYKKKLLSILSNFKLKSGNTENKHLDKCSRIAEKLEILLFKVHNSRNNYSILVFDIGVFIEICNYYLSLDEIQKLENFVEKTNHWREFIPNDIKKIDVRIGFDKDFNSDKKKFLELVKELDNVIPNKFNKTLKIIIKYKNEHNKFNEAFLKKYPRDFIDSESLHDDNIGNHVVYPFVENFHYILRLAGSNFVEKYCEAYFDEERRDLLKNNDFLEMFPFLAQDDISLIEEINFDVMRDACNEEICFLKKIISLDKEAIKSPYNNIKNVFFQNLAMLANCNMYFQTEMFLTNKNHSQYILPQYCSAQYVPQKQYTVRKWIYDCENKESCVFRLIEKLKFVYDNDISIFNEIIDRIAKSFLCQKDILSINELMCFIDQKTKENLIILLKDKYDDHFKKTYIESNESEQIEILTEYLKYSYESLKKDLITKNKSKSSFLKLNDFLIKVTLSNVPIQIDLLRRNASQQFNIVSNITCSSEQLHYVSELGVQELKETLLIEWNNKKEEYHQKFEDLGENFFLVFDELFENIQKSDNLF
ncbi:MAG: hypothetical protein Q8L85_01425 [Alphaproteobacteria bacterium]|nr:hypothetical protein [Alphaproteobacteria bacterium]